MGIYYQGRQTPKPTSLYKMKFFLLLGLIWVATVKGRCLNLDMWQEDCKQGSKIFETYPGHSSFSNTTCGQLCALLEDCKSFIYHFQTASCGLLKVFGGTTKDHDISGPELKLNPKLLIKEHGDYMYLFVNESKRFTEARDYCKGINMALASIKSAEENRFISDQAVEK